LLGAKESFFFFSFNALKQSNVKSQKANKQTVCIDTPLVDNDEG
jgi:hypothetical protein